MNTFKDETLQQTVLRSKLEFFGHVMRSDELEKGMMLAYRDWKEEERMTKEKMDV